MNENTKTQTLHKRQKREELKKRELQKRELKRYAFFLLPLLLRVVFLFFSSGFDFVVVVVHF